MTLEEFLKLEKPEEYDLKKEGGYQENSPLELALEYKFTKDRFDCDGSGEGKAEGLCTLIRELYRVLWGWNDVDKKGKVKRYAESSMTDMLMGPETMNSFFTSLGAYLSLLNEPKLQGKYLWKHNTIQFSEKMSREDREKRMKDEIPEDIKAYGDIDLVNSYVASTGKIGNMALTLAGFNRNIANDYWDIKLELQYFQNSRLSDYAKKAYVNLFFLWDYVDVRDNKYVFKPFFREHCAGNSFPKKLDYVTFYMKCAGSYIRRRSIFMVAMLRIAKEKKEIYDELVRNVFLRDKTYRSYHVVLQEIMDYLKDKEDLDSIRDILFEAEKRLSNFESRVATYFGFLYKRQGREHLEVFYRELGKIYQLGIDTYYSDEQRKKVIGKLIETANAIENPEVKVSCLVFAYMLNKDNKFDMNVPTIRLDETLIVDEPPRPFTDEMLAVMMEKHRQQYFAYMEEAKMVEDVLANYNVQIAAFHFKWNSYYAMFRDCYDGV